MSKIKFELNRAGVKELLKSEEIQAECREKANAALSRCGEGYAVHDVSYPERNGAAVAATNMRAVNDNKKNNTLLKAVRG